MPCKKFLLLHGHQTQNAMLSQLPIVLFISSMNKAKKEISSQLDPLNKEIVIILCAQWLFHLTLKSLLLHNLIISSLFINLEQNGVKRNLFVTSSLKVLQLHA